MPHHRLNGERRPCTRVGPSLTGRVVEVSVNITTKLIRVPVPYPQTSLPVTARMSSTPYQVARGGSRNPSIAVLSIKAPPCGRQQTSGQGHASDINGQLMAIVRPSLMKCCSNIPLSSQSINDKPIPMEFYAKKSLLSRQLQRHHQGWRMG